jgi:thymidylate synthase (FAD)
LGAGRSFDDYEAMLSQEGQQGLARELARMTLPASIYTQWYWKVDLHNLFHFLRLRADPHAQYEIRAYANVLCEIVRDWVPHAYAAFEDYRLNAVQFSGKAMPPCRRGGDPGDLRHVQGRMAGVRGGPARLRPLSGAARGA